MAIDLIYPLSALVLGAVAFTNKDAIPYAAGLILLMLVYNTFRGSIRFFL